MKDTLYKQKLGELKQFLAAKGWDASITPADDVQKYERINVNLYNGDKTIFWPAELLFLPGLEKDMHGYGIIQCYIPMIANVPAGMEIALAEMITRVNTKLALGGFGLLTTYHVLFYKHNTLLSDDNIDSYFPVIHETLFMASYLILHFQDAFVNVVTGKMSVVQAIETMPFGKLYK